MLLFNVVKHFISSFAGKHIHQSSGGCGAGSGLGVVCAFIWLLMSEDSGAEERSSMVPSTGAGGQCCSLMYLERSLCGCGGTQRGFFRGYNGGKCIQNEIGSWSEICCRLLQGLVKDL